MFFFSFFPGFFEPVCLFKAHVYIVGLVTHYSCRLGLMVFFNYLYSQFLMALIIGLFFPLGFHKWPSTVIICCDWCIIRSVSFVGSYSNNFNSILTYGLLVLLRKMMDDIIEVIIRFLWDNGINFFIFNNMKPLQDRPFESTLVKSKPQIIKVYHNCKY